MKQIFTLTAAVCFLGFSSAAQFSKGDKLFGGSFSFSVFDVYSSPGRQLNSNAGIAPSYGWFVKDNLLMGLRGGIAFSATKDRNNPSGVKSHNISLSPAIYITRFKTMKDKFGVTFTHQLSTGFNWQVTKFPGLTTRAKSRSAEYSLTPGVFYRFTENFMGLASLGGVYASWSNSNSRDSWWAGANFLQAFNLSIACRIGKNGNS